MCSNDGLTVCLTVVHRDAEAPMPRHDEWQQYMQVAGPRSVVLLNVALAHFAVLPKGLYATFMWGIDSSISFCAAWPSAMKYLPSRLGRNYLRLLPRPQTLADMGVSLLVRIVHSTYIEGNGRRSSRCVIPPTSSPFNLSMSDDSAVLVESYKDL